MKKEELKRELFRARVKGTLDDYRGYISEVVENGNTKYFITVTQETMTDRSLHGVFEVNKESIVKTDKTIFEWQVELCTEFLKKFTEKNNTYLNAGTHGLKSYTENYFKTYIDENAMIIAGKKMYGGRPHHYASGYKFKLKLTKEYLKLRR